MIRRFRFSKEGHKPVYLTLFDIQTGKADNLKDWEMDGFWGKDARGYNLFDNDPVTLRLSDEEFKGRVVLREGNKYVKFGDFLVPEGFTNDYLIHKAGGGND